MITHSSGEFLHIPIYNIQYIWLRKVSVVIIVLQGVNCVDYFHGGEKPYLISGADDRLVKIWDYQVCFCV